MSDAESNPRPMRWDDYEEVYGQGQVPLEIVCRISHESIEAAISRASQAFRRHRLEEMETKFSRKSQFPWLMIAGFLYVLGMVLLSLAWTRG